MLLTIEDPPELASAGDIQGESNISFALRRRVIGEGGQVGLNKVGTTVDDVTGIVDPLCRVIELTISNNAVIELTGFFAAGRVVILTRPVPVVPVVVYERTAYPLMSCGRTTAAVRMT